MFERKILREIYGPTKEQNGTGRTKTNKELDELIQHRSIINYVKARTKPLLCKGFVLAFDKLLNILYIPDSHCAAISAVSVYRETHFAALHPP